MKNNTPPMQFMWQKSDSDTDNAVSFSDEVHPKLNKTSKKAEEDGDLLINSKNNTDAVLSADVKGQIEEARKRLLDLSMRNSLLNFNFNNSERKNNQIRIVDTNVNAVFSSLLGGKRLELLPLPELPNAPKDEQTEKFQNALNLALVSDEIFLKEREKLEKKSEPDEKEEERILRELKNRIREQLGLPKLDDIIITKQEWARENNINPSYDSVPFYDKTNHLDKLQTLLYFKELITKLTALRRLIKSDNEEKGTNTFYISFCCLEWTEDENSSKKHYAPLLLLKLEGLQANKKEMPFIQSAGDPVQINLSLREKLKDFGISLPNFEEEDTPDIYADKVRDAVKRQKNWKVRNFLTIGRFIFTRLVMYEDLKLENWPMLAKHMEKSTLLQSLFKGIAESSMGETYDIDKDSVVIKNAPILVHSADSSQHSAIVDAMCGENLVIKGPPGTGKSQTITNLIANALNANKKVLFISEKKAALDVVYSRLKKANLGDYCLELHSDKTRIANLRHELEIAYMRYYNSYHKPRIFTDIVDNKKYKQAVQSKLDIRDYYASLQELVGSSEKTLFDIVWQTKLLERYLKDFPESFKDIHIVDALNKTADIFEDELTKLSNLEKLYNSYVEATEETPRLKVLDLSEISSQRISRIIQEIKLLSEKYSEFIQKLETAKEQINLNSIDTGKDLNECVSIIQKAREIFQKEDVKKSLLSSLASKQNLTHLLDYETKAQSYNSLYAEVKEYLKSPEMEWQKDDEYKDLISSILAFLPKNTNKRILFELESELKEERDYWNKNSKYLLEVAQTVYGRENINVSEIIITKKILDKLSEFQPNFLTFLKNKNLFLTEFNSLLKDAKDKIDSINSLSDELSKLFDMNLYESDENIIKHNIQILAQAGLFSFFCSDYRRAKRFYENIALDKKVKKYQRIENLRKLLAYEIENRRFKNNAQFKEVLGIYYSVDTPINVIYELNNLFVIFEQISSQYGNSAIDPWKQLFLDESVTDLKTIYNFAKRIELKDFKTYYSEQRDSLWIEYEHNLDELISLVTKFNTEFLPIIVADNPDLMEMSFELEQLSNLKAQKKDIDETSRVISAFLGNFDKQEHTDFISLKPTIEVSNIVHNCRFFDNPVAILEQNTESLLENYNNELSVILQNYDDLSKGASKIFATIQLDVPEYFGVGEIDLIKFTYLEKEMNFLKTSQNALHNTWAYQDALRDIRNTNLKDIVDPILNLKKPLANLSQIYSYLYYNTLADFYNNNKGSKFIPNKFEDLAKEIRQLDDELILENRKFLAEKLSKTSVPNGYNSPKVSEKTELSLIKHQISGNARQIPLRNFLSRAGKAIMALKPCFLMSPISLAQYIEPNNLKFDLLIIDEASQMYFEEALGAIFRSDQLVVVGDEKQLPPTPFFQKSLVEEDDDEDEFEDYGIQSILETCITRGFPVRELLWHYRSKDPSLIAFSNKFFYNNKLKLFPSPLISSDIQGITRIYLKDGVYKSRQNEVEADEIIRHVKQFVRKYPNRSIGIATMNTTQKTLLEQKIDQLAASDKNVKEYIENWEKRDKGLEYFFIKNLENVQGDERDYIFVSTVYGPEEGKGRVLQRFGPINGKNGHRRLNVLFTRAKYGLKLFTSMKASDIVVSESSSQGLKALQGYLSYAETGRLEAGEITNRPMDSYFEEMVKTVLESKGYEVDAQVGVKGFFIDLAVKHPLNKSFYALGIECDGAPYHSTKSARDRDCIRQAILEELGWKIYRIWSKDWFFNTEYEIERLLRYVEEVTSIPPEKLNDKGVYDEDNTEDEITEDIIEDEKIYVPTDTSKTVEIGDTITYKRTDTNEEKTIRIVSGKADVSSGTINENAPLAIALLGNEVGGEIEVNNYVIIILKVIKNA